MICRFSVHQPDFVWFLKTVKFLVNKKTDWCSSLKTETKVAIFLLRCDASMSPQTRIKTILGTNFDWQILFGLLLVAQNCWKSGFEWLCPRCGIPWRQNAHVSTTFLDRIVLSSVTEMQMFFFGRLQGVFSDKKTLHFVDNMLGSCFRLQMQKGNLSSKKRAN